MKNCPVNAPHKHHNFTQQTDVTTAPHGFVCDCACDPIKAYHRRCVGSLICDQLVKNLSAPVDLSSFVLKGPGMHARLPHATLDFQILMYRPTPIFAAKMQCGRVQNLSPHLAFLAINAGSDSWPDKTAQFQYNFDFFGSSTLSQAVRPRSEGQKNAPA